MDQLLKNPPGPRLDEIDNIPSGRQQPTVTKETRERIERLTEAILKIDEPRRLTGTLLQDPSKGKIPDFLFLHMFDYLNNKNLNDKQLTIQSDQGIQPDKEKEDQEEDQEYKEEEEEEASKKTHKNKIETNINIQVVSKLSEFNSEPSQLIESQGLNDINKFLKGEVFGSQSFSFL